MMEDPMRRVFGLMDCNNFYCSCERAFDPRLEGVPVLVLSNNDGCAIARSAEVKALGIKMGDPAFHEVRAATEVADVWGIGPAHVKRLRAVGIDTALKLRDADSVWVRKTMSVVGLRTVLELRGVSCISMEQAPATRKGVTCSRSF